MLTAKPTARALRFGALCLLAIVAVGGYVLVTGARNLGLGRSSVTLPVTSAAAKQDLAAGPYLLFESTAPDSNFGRVEVVPLGQRDGPRYLTPLSCARIAFRGQRGICLDEGNGPLSVGAAYVLDNHLQRQYTIPFSGIPSRARVSNDGRFAASTVFVSGDSYTGGFSTRTTIVDLQNPSAEDPLEQYSVLKDGAPFSSVDFNFWGVTFSHDDVHFFATLLSGGTTYLLRGDVQTRTATVLRENVECPSLSPDETRLVFKKRTELPTGTGWRLTVLDLKTMQETSLAETNSVDDQAEWLDNDHVLYGLPDKDNWSSGETNVWEVPSDGSGAPELFLPAANSPIVVRGSLDLTD
jgi:hypothetical protein